MKIVNGKPTWHHTSARGLLLLIFMIVSFLILSSCGDRKDPPTPVVVLNSNTPCPTYIPRKNFQSEYSPMLVYVLVEGTENYGELITHSFDIMEEVLKTKVQPKDKLLVSFMEYIDIERTRLFNGEVANVEIPPYVYSPLVQPTLPTSVPLPTKAGSFGNIVQTTAVRVTETVYSSLLTQVADKHNCGQIIEEKENQLLFDKWNSDRLQAINQFLNDYSESVSKVDLSDLPETTNPFRALSQASEIFNLFRDSGKFKNSYLIIFSNLGSVISNSPIADGIDLRGINVLVVLQKCTFLSDCSGKVGKWETYFMDAGASAVTFVPKGDEKEVLILHLER